MNRGSSMAEEKNFEKKIKKFLSDEGVWFVKTWSNGVQRSGIPDIIASVNGYFVGIEVKASKGKPSELQIYNLRNIYDSGGFALLLYPDDFADFQRLVHALLISNGCDEDYNKAGEIEHMIQLKHNLRF